MTGLTKFAGFTEKSSLILSTLSVSGIHITHTILRVTRAATPRHELLLIALALVFGWLGAASLAWQRNDLLSLVGIGVLSGCALASHVWLNRVAPTRAFTLLPIVVVLLAFGILAIARVAPNFLVRQLAALGISTVAMLAVASSRDQLRWLRRFKYTWLIGAFVLLAATLFLGVNPTGFGARLWLSIGGAYLQPSEILRLLVIAFLAAYFAERLEIPTPLHAPLSTLHSLLPTLAMWLIGIALLATQQDLGAATLLLLTFGFMLFLATGSARLPLVLAGALLIAGGIGYWVSARVAQRLDIWLNPWADPQGASFQVVQSLIAIANGGVLGQGIGQGKPDYVPAVHTDFPFVMITEELGLIGAIALIACYAALCLLAWRIAQHASSPYRMLLAGGIAAAIAVQVFIIIGGNLSLVPLTGVTLPFVSYGGTSLLMSSIAVGLLVRMSGDATANGRAPLWQGSIRAVRSAMILTTILFGLLAISTGMWSIVNAYAMTSREDNPRNVDAELAIQRGNIYDRMGRVLAMSELIEITKRVPKFARRYLVPEAAPATGYYSQRYGVGGVEAFADARLRGQRTAWDILVHAPQVGSPITLTLDMDVQTAAEQALQAAMPNTVTRGAVVVMDASNGWVIALASAPSFDPNTLDDAWEQLTQDPFAPLVNRATQGLYQPGLLLRWMLAAKAAKAAKDEGAGMKGEITPSSFILHLASFNLDKPVPFELQNQAVAYPATATYSETIGQGTLRVTPLRVAVVVAQLAAGAPITPTLMLTNTQPTRVVQPVAPFTTFARTGTDAFVGWCVQVVGNRVVVVAIEMPQPDESVLERVAEEVR